MDALRRVKNAPKADTSSSTTMTPGSAGVTSGDLTPASITGAGETNGGMVSGFPITSPYGPRTHPVTGQPGKLHGGIDVGTPTGTPLALNAPGGVLLLVIMVDMVSCKMYGFHPITFNLDLLTLVSSSEIW